MKKPKLLIFSPEAGELRMLQLWFCKHEFNVTTDHLEGDWESKHVLQTYQEIKPDAVLIWDMGSPKMFSTRNELINFQPNIAVTLIMHYWPKGFTEEPDYLFVHPFDISKVEAFIKSKL